MKKFTDEQIIEALEYYKSGEHLTEDDISIILKGAFDLINRQKQKMKD